MTPTDSRELLNIIHFEDDIRSCDLLMLGLLLNLLRLHRRCPQLRSVYKEYFGCN